jgi:hypothetical protein
LIKIGQILLPNLTFLQKIVLLSSDHQLKVNKVKYYESGLVELNWVNQNIFLLKEIHFVIV